MRYMSWTEYSAQLDTRREQAAQIWLTRTSRRLAGWRSFMLWAIRKASEQALIPLDVAIHFSAIRPSQRLLYGYLKTLAEHFLERIRSPQTQYVDAIHQLVCDYVELASLHREPFPIDQQIIFLILEHCSIEQTRSLFHTLLTHDMPLSSDTLLHIADNFLTEGEATIGLEILRSAVNVGADPSSVAFQSSCVKLLRTRSESEDWIKVRSDLLSQILEMGVRPNCILWTCIILNAIEAGEYQEAWRWYDIGIQNGVKPNRGTFSVLLKITKQGFSKESLDRVVEEASKEQLLPNDLELVFDALHAIWLSERSNSPQGPDRAFESMLRFYSRYCDLKPLQDLNLPLEPYLASLEQNNEASQPSPRMVGIMLLGYLSQPSRLAVLAALYLRYHSHVKAEHSIIAPLANTDHVSNAFIKAFGSKSDGLGHCNLVVKNMLARTSTTTPEPETFGNTNPGQTGKPTVQTWNILLNSYMKYGHTQAAEKILLMMHARGMKPNDVTWNHVIAGYVRKQDVENVVGASKRMKDAGFEYNDFTIQALRRLVDKQRYLSAMENEPSTRAKPFVEGQESPPEAEEEHTVAMDLEATTRATSTPRRKIQRLSERVPDTISSSQSGADTTRLESEMVQYNGQTQNTEAALMPSEDCCATSEGSNCELHQVQRGSQGYQKLNEPVG